MKPGQGDWKTALEGQSRRFKGLGSLLNGLIAAALVVLTLAIAVVLATEEQNMVAGLVPTATAMHLPTATPSPLPTLEPPTPRPTPSSLPSPSPTPTPQPLPSAAARCVPPADWRLYTVQRGDSLTLLSWRFWISEYVLMQGNCLSSRVLRTGQRLYVPDVSPRQACGKPSGWVAYTIQSGDTLSSLARWFGVTVTELKQANCLTGDTIYAGATLWVPYPKPTATRRPIPTPVPTRTPVPSATATATITALPILTETPTGSETPGPTESATASPEPTSDTPAPTTPSVTTEATGTVPPSETTGPTDTPSPPTATQAPSDTPSPPTATPVPPTSTPVPPTATPVPPTATAVPPTATNAP